MTDTQARPDRRTTECPENMRATHALIGLSDSLWNFLLEDIFVIPELAALTSAHLRLLYWIHERTLVTTREVSESFGGTPVGVRRLIRDLVRRRLLNRGGELHAPNIVYLGLSPTGRSLLARLEASHQQSLRRLLNQFSSDEQQEFARVLCLLLETDQDRSLQQETETPDPAVSALHNTGN